MGTRPARSNSYLRPEEAARVEAEARGYFDGVALKRTAKPPRSDPSGAAASSGDAGGDIPELHKRPRLVLDALDGSGEEYVETECYDGINAMNKPHHTIGTGFIKVDKPNGSSFHVTIVSYSSSCLVHCTSDPATNDWIPSSEMIPWIYPQLHQVDSTKFGSLPILFELDQASCSFFPTLNPRISFSFTLDLDLLFRFKTKAGQSFTPSQFLQDSDPMDYEALEKHQ